MNKNNKLINLGCRLNIYEGEIIKKHFKDNNLNHITVINSCAVTAEAEKKVAYEIRKAKRRNPNNKIVVTDFWASWCNPCLMIAPHLEAISDEMKEVVVAKHNIDEEPNTPTKFGVRGIPTMLLFKDGELASTKVGATTKSNIQDWIKENL